MTNLDNEHRINHASCANKKRCSRRYSAGNTQVGHGYTPRVFLLQAGCKTACLYLEPSASKPPPATICATPPRQKLEPEIETDIAINIGEAKLILSIRCHTFCACPTSSVTYDDQNAAVRLCNDALLVPPRIHEYRLSKNDSQGVS